MLEIVIPESELFNDSTQEFVEIPSHKITLEHSLVSMSKWEMLWKKPFLKELSSDEGLGTKEMLSYIQCMTVTKGVDPITYYGLNDELIKEINEYINDPMTATTFNTRENDIPGSRQPIITSEVLYQQMIIYGIPFECQKWHLNRLLTLLRVCQIKTGPQKKMSKSDTAQYFDELNRRRMAKSKMNG